jgi:hypothetical protein
MMNALLGVLSYVWGAQRPEEGSGDTWGDTQLGRVGRTV